VAILDKWRTYMKNHHAEEIHKVFVKLGVITPPQLRTLNEGERSATWLELFFDLVFVGAVAMLSTRLAHLESLKEIGSYVGYFTLIWWLWASHTFYANRFDTDDFIYRFLATIQMIAITFIAVSLSYNHKGESTHFFALGYTVSRFVIVLLYIRAYRYIEEIRRLTLGYAIGFGIGAIFWYGSIWVSEPLRFIFWGIALGIDLLTPYLLRRLQAKVPLDISHFPERFGLFTILVLGETVIAVVMGLSHVDWQINTTVVGVAGIILAVTLWWLHFDNVDGFVVRRRGKKKDWRPTAWIYGHLPLSIGLAMTGVGVELAISETDHHGEYSFTYQWVLIIGLIIAFASMALIETASKRKYRDTLRKKVVTNRLVAIPLLLGLGCLNFTSPIALMSVVVSICFIEVGVDIMLLHRYNTIHFSSN